MSQFYNFTSQKPNPQFDSVLDVLPEEVWQARSQVAIIDVRRPDEYTGELGHIPGASLLTLDQLPQRLDELPKDKSIVFVCRSGGRSGQAAAFALENGFSSVFNMFGGMLLWNEKNMEVEGRE